MIHLDARFNESIESISVGAYSTQGEDIALSFSEFPSTQLLEKQTTNGMTHGPSWVVPQVVPSETPHAPELVWYSRIHL